MASITINGITIDTDAPKAALAALALAHDTADASDYVLVQAAHPLAAAERAQLAQAGATILESVPGALLCHFPGTDLQPLRALPFVRWADLYPAVVKLHPRLLGMAPSRGGVAAAAVHLAHPDPMDATPVQVDAVLHRNADPAKAAQAIAAAAQLNPGQLTALPHKVRLTLRRSRLAAVAALDMVRHVEEVARNQLFNNVARTILGIDSAPAAPQVPYTGKGQRVAVADTGFDRGSTSDVHPAFQGRVHRLYALGRPGMADDPDGHGTHVCGSVLGDGQSSSDGPVRGAAPEAMLVMQSVLDAQGGLGGLPPDLNDLFTPPYRDDQARIHSNSWGANHNSYDAQCQELDAFVYQHRDFLVCVAAGNAGVDGSASGHVDPGSVGTPAVAKNCLTVGASENLRPQMTLTWGQGWPSSYPAEPIKSDRSADNPEGMAPFSSRGPTHDGRIKPDVVAPGTWILSTRSRATQGEGWGASGDPLYMFEGGTSMATPLVAGSMALIRQFLAEQHQLAAPSAALLKALVINGAHDLAGQYVPSEAGAVPGNDQGFGRADVRAVVGPYRPGESLQFFDEDQALDTGASHDIPLTVPAGTTRLKVTLVWTDPPGEGLQNDLDLIVTLGGGERHGNVAPGSSGFDRSNNVEQVEWAQPPQGSGTVRVQAFNITATPQSYALVIRLA